LGKQTANEAKGFYVASIAKQIAYERDPERKEIERGERLCNLWEE
jgi:hypothetical protein